MPAPPTPEKTFRCPNWCDRTFCDESELPSDRMHRSPIVEVAGVVRKRWVDSSGKVVRAAEPVTLNVLASKYVEEHRTWVVVTTDEHSLEISVETARELHVVLGHLLEEALF